MFISNTLLFYTQKYNNEFQLFIQNIMLNKSSEKTEILFQDG